MILKNYLNFIFEKLEDIRVDKKWYDFINLTYRKALKSEIERIFNENFKINHPLINNNLTEIKVTIPYLGYVYYILIELYDKNGKYLLNLEHEGNTFNEPLVIQIKKEKNKQWTLYYHTLFLKDEYQNKGIGKKVIESINLCMKKLQNTKEYWVQATDIGRYFVSRIPECKFKKDSKFGEKI